MTMRDDDYEEDVGRDSEPTYFEPREPCEPCESSRRKEVSAEERRNKVVNIHATTQLKVVLVKPERFENASEIADHLREKRTVVLNLEGTNKDVARRLVDFLSGGPTPVTEDQEGLHHYLYHHALFRGSHGRPDRRAGEQRPVPVRAG